MNKREALSMEMKEAKLHIIKDPGVKGIKLDMDATAAAACALIGHVLCEIANNGVDDFECVKALCISILEEAEENENAKD